jgi:hypothetical protein
MISIDRRRASFAWSTLLLLCLAGCGSRAATPAAPAAPTSAPQGASALLGDTLYLRESTPGAGELAVVDTASGARMQLPFGTPNHDWSVIYSVEQDASAGQTLVRASDTAMGATLRELRLEGEYALPVVSLDGTPSGLSPNGKWLVLAGASKQEGLTNRFAVVDTSFEREPELVDLPGLFSFDAISDSGTSLYLTEHAPEDRAKYQVRLYHVRRGELDARVIVDKANQAVMRGIRAASVASADGRWLFSLYLNDAQGPFIHALNTQEQFAMCLFLPRDGAQDARAQLHWALALAPDGGRLYAVNGALGLIAEIDARSPKILNTRHLDGAAAEQPGHEAHAPGADSTQGSIASLVATGPLPVGLAARSPDGATLFARGRTGLLAIDTRELALRATYLPDRPLVSLALSGDGERLYAVGADEQLYTLNPSDGALLRSLPARRGTLDLLWVATR